MYYTIIFETRKTYEYTIKLLRNIVANAFSGVCKNIIFSDKYRDGFACTRCTPVPRFWPRVWRTIGKVGMIIIFIIFRRVSDSRETMKMLELM